MTRDPVQKAFSQYMHLIRDTRETLDFPGALDAEEARTAQGYSAMWRYAESSLFAERTQRFIDTFGRAHLKIVRFEDFVASPQETMRSVFEFIGVDPNVEIELEASYNRSGVPRSRIVARLISGGNPITTLARRLLPVAVTTKIRDVIQRVNTGSKHSLDSETRLRLEQYFAADREEFEAVTGESLGAHSVRHSEDP